MAPSASPISATVNQWAITKFYSSNWIATGVTGTLNQIDQFENVFIY